MKESDIEAALKGLIEIHDQSVGRIRTLEEKVLYLEEALEWLAKKLLDVHKAGVQPEHEYDGEHLTWKEK